MNIISGVLRDERGSLSAARTFLFASLVFTAAIIAADSLLWATVPNAAYALLGTIFTGLLAWTAGPRIAQYLGPQIGAVTSGIAQAVKSPKRPDLLDSSPNFKEHDEK
jgi:hypothetical protein|tara:strand:- start:43 stop:366 length:324 start_codon:yes stop_codon:yes gene_type:complete